MATMITRSSSKSSPNLFKSLSGTFLGFSRILQADEAHLGSTFSEIDIHNLWLRGPVIAFREVRNEAGWTFSDFTPQSLKSEWTEECESLTSELYDPSS